MHVVQQSAPYAVQHLKSVVFVACEHNAAYLFVGKSRFGKIQYLTALLFAIYVYVPIPARYLSVFSFSSILKL